MPRIRGAIVRHTAQSTNIPHHAFVDLLVHSIKCVKSTKEVDRDEIALAAIKIEGAIEESGNKRKLAAKAESGELLRAGKFKGDEDRHYNPARRAARFAFGATDQGWPRRYQALFILIEKDEGALGTIVAEAVRSVEKQAKDTIAKAATAAATAAFTGVAAGAAAGSVVPLVGTAIGAAAGAAAGAAMAEIKKARHDDVFEPHGVNLELASASPDASKLGRREVVFRGFKGVYKVTYSWDLA